MFADKTLAVNFNDLGHFHKVRATQRSKAILADQHHPLQNIAGARYCQMMSCLVIRQYENYRSKLL